MQVDPSPRHVAAIELFESLSYTTKSIILSRLESKDPTVDWVTTGHWLYNWADEMRELGAIGDVDHAELQWVASGWKAGQ